jgi:hypothetical protein
MLRRPEGDFVHLFPSLIKIDWRKDNCPCGCWVKEKIVSTPYSNCAPDVALHKWLVRGLVHTSDYISAAI